MPKDEEKKLLLLTEYKDKPLTDSITYIEMQPDIIQESIEKHKGKLVIEDVLLQKKDVVNQNGRMYPGDILVKEAKRYEESFVKNRSSFGELDHPNTTFVSLANSSHIISEIWWKDDELYGNLEVLGTPMGEIVRAILNSGAKVGVSSRALGSVKRIQEAYTGKEFDEVQSDLEILCWDIVSNPSVVGATLTLKESLDAVSKAKMDRINKINEITRKILTIELM